MPFCFWAVDCPVCGGQGQDGRSWAALSYSCFYLEGLSKLPAMDSPAGHPLIGIVDDVGDLLWHTVVSLQLPDGLSVCTVGCLFMVDEVDVERGISLQ